MSNKNETVGNSLIPIKGISQAQKKALNTKCQIYDISGLLSKGRTPEQRKDIADKLGLEKKYVNLWVKQADLWRVMGMTADYAYLLVLAGIRTVSDLAKVNVEKTQQMLVSLSNTHPGFNWDNTYTSVLVSLVFNATLLESTSISQTLQEKRVGDFENILQENFQKKLIEQIEENSQRNEEIIKYSESFKQILNSFNWNNTKIGTFNSDNNEPASASLQQLPLDMSDEEEPEYLFEKFYKEEPIGKSDSEVIEEGLGFLQDIAISLPLPKIISGLVKIRSQNEDKSKSKTTAAVSDLLVELTGVINPMTESKEDSAPVSAYTDGNGRFNLVMPDKYNFQDSVTFTFSYGSWKQSFTKTASEIIENTVIRDGGTDENGNPLTAQKIISQFDLLDSTNKKIKQLENKINVLEKIEFWKTKKAEVEEELSTLLKDNDGEETLIEDTDIQSKKNEIEDIKAEIKRLEKGKIDLSITKTEEELKKEIKEKEKEIDDILAIIYGADSTTNDLEKTLTNLMARTDLESCFDGDENDDKCKNKCFVIIEEVFKGYRDSKPKALPSVRLMGEGDTATWLPTDTAPSRTYSYTMLQRLVEPAIYPAAGENRQRRKLTSPINVANFKNDIMTKPESIPKMASLGIGYVLNMHQAWVPDGFALGTLLYSLILAPGEEQRLIVREHSEEYEVLDTFEGSDETSESTARTQSDDIQAIYDYMMHSDSSAYSKSTYKSSGWSIGGSASGGGGGFSLGLSGGYSKSKGSSTTTSRQSNNQNEASNAAQSFNQQFATTANLLAKAKRVSIRTASSSESDSVATKIIANHNHSHAMTVQYWEVVRRYRLETCIDGVDLLLFVPLELVRFLPKGQTLNTSFSSSFGMDQFSKRYATLIQYYSTLRYALPYKYRNGLDLIQKFSALPNWKVGDDTAELKDIKITLRTNLFEHDIIGARLYLKNGKGSVVASVTVTNPIKLSTMPFYSTASIKDYIRETVNGGGYATTVELNFTLPPDTLPDEIANLYISHDFRDANVPLTIDPDKKEYYDNWGRQIDLDAIIKNYWDKLYDVKKDQKNTVEDTGKMDYWRSQIPEGYFTPITYISARELKTLGYSKFKLEQEGNKVTFTQSSDALYLGVTMYPNCPENYLHYSEFQKMEETLQHIASETLRYSQRVWQTLSSNELAIMLEQYNIDMNFKTYFDVENDSTYIPLLNCVNVKRVMGYYGNCILLPFTYPEELAVKLGKTAAEIQDSLYRYHTSCFRAPSTTISIPTDGMIGEAVLGATNVSEEIDLTRFWNWKDSPIDSMNLDSSYLSGGDYLGNKTTKDFGALNLQTATQQTPVTATDLISALVAKQTPQFDNITGLEQTATLLNNAMNSTSTGRDNVINQSSTLAGKAMEYATQKLKSEAAERVAQINASKDEKKDDDSKGQSSDSKNPDDEKNPDSGKDPDNGKTPKNKDSSMDSIVNGIVDAIKNKQTPEQYFTSVTGKNDDSINDAASKFCSWFGSDLSSVIGSILG